jgi:hypothetical protein
MTMDPANPVVALCVAGMEREGTPDEARALFARAWQARRDDYEAAVAAHFLARHQPTPADTLHWNEVALRHGEAVPDGRADELMASLYLNVGDSYLAVGRRDAAAAAAARAAVCAAALPADGYRELVERGIRGLHQRLGGNG